MLIFRRNLQYYFLGKVFYNKILKCNSLSLKRCIIYNIKLNISASNTKFNYIPIQNGGI